MATRIPLRPSASLLSQCHARARRSVEFGLHDANPARHMQQVRGKAKKAVTIPVRLMRDVTGYGPKGSIIRVRRGQMRNHWYPSEMADYVLLPEYKQLKRAGAAMSRKLDFVTEEDQLLREKEAAEAAESTSPDPSQVMASIKSQQEAERVSAERSIELLKILVPPRIDFHRVPIEREEAPPTDSPGRTNQETVSALYGDSTASKAAPTGIFGSVTVADVAAQITAILAENDEAAKIVLSDAEIGFVPGQSDDGNRIRHIGEFEVEIRVRGSPQSIKKIVRVLPSEKARAAEVPANSA